MIKILLRGGPDGLGPVFELEAQTLPERIAVPYCGCHQHFEHVDDVDHIGDRSLPVFRWTYPTAIAE